MWIGFWYTIQHCAQNQQVVWMTCNKKSCTHNKHKSNIDKTSLFKNFSLELLIKMLRAYICVSFVYGFRRILGAYPFWKRDFFHAPTVNIQMHKLNIDQTSLFKASSLELLIKNIKSVYFVCFCMGPRRILPFWKRDFFIFILAIFMKDKQTKQVIGFLMALAEDLAWTDA